MFVIFVWNIIRQKVGFGDYPTNTRDNPIAMNSIINNEKLLPHYLPNLTNQTNQH